MAKILVIEDMKHQQLIYRHDLTHVGHKVFTADRAEDGIDMAIDEKPDLIVLDVMLPGMDGLEACRYFKKSPITKEIPIILVSAKSQRGDIVKGVQAGANHYFVKPFNFKDLNDKINQILDL